MRALLAVILFVAAAPPAFAQNAGFENGLVEWSPADSGTWSVNTLGTFIRSGVRSAVLTTSSTSDGIIANPTFSVTTSPVGSPTVTVIAWVRTPDSTHAVAVGVSDGVTPQKGGEVTITPGVYVRMSHTFSAATGTTYFPRLYGRSTTGAAVSLYFDDVIIYHGTMSAPDLAPPAAAMGIHASPSGTQIALTWTPGPDSAGSGIEGVLILRRAGVTATDQSVLNQTRYSSTNPLVGPTSVGGWTVVYNGTQSSSFTDDPGSTGIYTYLVFMRDSAWNYTSGGWAGARIFVFNGTGLSANTQVNTRLDGLYLPATCTLSSDPASTVTIRAGADITVHGTIINHGNIYVRSADLPPPQVNFAAGSLYDFNRNGTSTGSELFSVIDATWLPGSTCRVSGITTLFPGGLNQAFSNLIWACSSQTVTDTLGTSEGPTIVNGDFTLVSTGTGGVLLSTDAGSNRFRGSFTVAGGILDAGPGAAAYFDGGSVQPIDVSGGTIAGSLSAIFDNPAGFMLGSDLLLAAADFANGVVATGTSTLAIASGGSVTRTAGHVAGLLRKGVPAGSPSMLFEIGDATRYTPLELLFSSVSAAGNLTASTTTGDHPAVAGSGLDPARTVNRYYTLSAAGLGFDTAEVLLHFDPADVDPLANTAYFVVKKYDAPAWSATINGGRGPTSVRAKGITSFSDLAIGEGVLFTIVATAEAGGSIAPSGNVTVVGGDDQSFTINPDPFFLTDSVLVNGVNLGPLTSYTFPQVSANHTIAAYFSPSTHTITATAGPGGSIVPAGAVTVPHGTDTTFAVVPDPGHRTDSVVVDGANLGAVPSYTFTNVVTDHTISAYFSPMTFVITASASGGGTIAPSGAIPVLFGGTVSFVMTAEPYHHLDSVVVDGTNIGTPPTYVFSAVAASHTISAYFSMDRILFLSLSPDSIFNENPLRRGSSLKPVRRESGRYPNWSNLVDEVVLQGGFAPGTSESDSAGGAVIGISYMSRRSAEPERPHWRPDRDSARVYAWGRLSAWNFKRGTGRGFIVSRPRALQRSLGDRTGSHTGPARGFILSGSNQPMRGQYRFLGPKRFNNRLIAELVALKFNIAASQLGKVPHGFGDLVFHQEGSPFNGMSVLALSARADSMMTRWPAYPPAAFDSLYGVLHRINRACEGPLDTIRFHRPDSFFINGTLIVKGQVLIEDVPFLRMPVPFRATRISPASPAVEPEDEFEDEEFDEEEDGAPVAPRLYQNYPNPFNPTTRIAFRLGEPSRVTIRVYNLLGQEIGHLAEDEEFEDGINTVDFTAEGLASGVYLYRIVTEGLDGEGRTSTETRKMLLLR